ncbi:ICOS ligand-like [Brachionichthys hirsutus]|uniref:ICOS ligand-like n=1 Tax=Brachionichthys hirsutus TaxID=412623 RepID=UPI0036045022
MLFSLDLKWIVLERLFVSRAQKRPPRAMPSALWRAGLLLCLLSSCSCLERCVLGIVGRPVSLPCLSLRLETLINFSIEWRRDEEVVLRSVFEERKPVEELSANSANIPDDAAQTGNFSLELPTVDPKEHNKIYSLIIISEENPNDVLCTVCLQIAASFSTPMLLQREDAEEGGELTFLCRSRGGFPEPSIHWFINNTEEPPEGSVRTVTAPLPDSHLFNVTSHLTTNISRGSSVSCSIENQLINETLTSVILGVEDSHVVIRASQAMWIFSTALCAVVGVLVIVGVGYQIFLDRLSKRKKRDYEQSIRGNKRRSPYRETEVTEETAVMKSDPKETGV